MKMRKILSLALALLMLVSTTFILSACSERDGYVKLSKKQVKVDLTDYGLVYGDSMTGNDYTVTFKERMSDFAAMLNKATGESFVAYSVDRAKTNKGDKEILIGLTNREESKKVYNSIKGDGFAIEVTDKKVVIVGSSNLFTLQAVQYFADKYLSDSEKVNPELSINQKAQAFKMQSVTIADAEESYFSYVHDASLGILPPVYKGVSGSTLANNTYKDYPQVAIDLIVQKMVAQTGLRDKAFKIEKDSDTAEKEVLVGMVARDENKALLATLADDQYRITVQENQIQVTGWNDVTIKGAVTEYIDLLIEGTAEDKSVSLPIGLSLSGRVDKDWKTDFPKPEGEGIELYNTMDASDNALQYLYMGDGVNATSYKAYCDTLKAAGYSILSENSIEDSLFTTFVNRMEGITLYVAYNAFKHRDEFSAYSYTDSKDETGDKGYYEQDPCFRIVSAPLDSVTLADSTLLTKNPAYDKKTDSMITTMPIYSKAVGLSYVVTLEDGRFIVFDGGGVNDDAATAEHKVLWSTLTMLQERISGKAVSSSNPVHIAAWVLTHAHWDHYYAFVRMADTYGSSGQLKMDYMFANVPTQEGSYAGAAGLNVMSDELVASLKASIRGGFKYIKLHTGDKLYLANCEIEVITTWEDLNPIRTNNSNDTNTVLRFTMTNKDNPNQKITQMWTGDANRWQSRFMCAMYGSYLKSDMTSVAHHGNAGCEVEFYDLISPTVVWWPHNAGQVANYLNPANEGKGWQYEVDQHLMYKIDTVKYLYTSGNKSGDTKYSAHYVTMVLTENGPDYDGVFDLMTGQPVDYCAVTDFYKVNYVAARK